MANAPMTSSIAEETIHPMISELRTELTSLNRVFHKLAMTDAGPSLERVLNLLLPRLLRRTGKNDDERRRGRRDHHHQCAGGRGNGSNNEIQTNNVNKRKTPSSPPVDGVVDGVESMAVVDVEENVVDISPSEKHEIESLRDSIHDRLIEMLGHVMKRVREDRSCKLPCGAILESLSPPPPPSSQDDDDVDVVMMEGRTTSAASATTSSMTTSNPLAINLGLTFLTLGINRCTPSECAVLLPSLLAFFGRTLDRRRRRGPNGDSAGGTTDDDATEANVGVSHLSDPGGCARHDRAYHLVLRCLESMSSSSSPPAAVVGAMTPAVDAVAHLRRTRMLLGSDPVVSSALFDMLVDVILYSPVPKSSSLIPPGLSESSHKRLIGGAASETYSGWCSTSSGGGDNNWGEEYAASSSLGRLKLRLLDLIAPCRSVALFLPEKNGGRGEGDSALEKGEAVGDGTSTAIVASDAGGRDAGRPFDDGMGISRTVALMVLLAGDVDPGVSSKAESYLRVHMDARRRRDVRRRDNDDGEKDSSSSSSSVTTTTVLDPLLGNSMALARTMLALAVGGASSMSIERTLMSQYGNNEKAIRILGKRHGLTYCAPDDVDVDIHATRKALLSCARMRISEHTAAYALKFVSKIIDDDPRLFHVSGLDVEEEDSDVAAVLIGTMALTVVSDLHRPGSLASLALKSAAALLNSLCVRLSLFYDARVRSSGADAPLGRLRSLLARCVRQACAVLAPTSTGESTSLASDGTRGSILQVDIRDKCYGVLCTLSRSHFALDDGYALFDCGDGSNGGRSPGPLGSFSPLRATSTAAMLFGCSSNEVEMLRPRAISALDALLFATIRVVTSLDEKEKVLASFERESLDNPWSGYREVATTKQRDFVSTDGLSRSLLPLLWRAARRSQPKSSRLAAARWSSELLLRLDGSSAFHLLCFISGDDDSTVSVIARRALGVDKWMGEDNILSMDYLPGAIKDGDDKTVRVAFSVLMDVIVIDSPGCERTIQQNDWPKFAKFNVVSKTVTIRFLLQSLFSAANVYADKHDRFALKEFVAVIFRTLETYKSRTLSRDETDLIDECTVALASCTSTSKDARLFVVGRNEVDGLFSYRDVAKQALTSNSSRARVSTCSFSASHCMIFFMLTWTFCAAVVEAPRGNNESSF